MGVELSQFFFRFLSVSAHSVLKVTSSLTALCTSIYHNTAMLPSSIHPQKCALCEEPATHACGDCKDTPSIAGQMEETTYYCTRACQMLDRASHKEHCKRLKPRKELYRAGKILLSMFLLFREKVYDGTIIRAERRDSKLFIHNGEVFPPDRDIDILAPFPASVFDDLEAKHAALTALACNDASAWMHDMIDYFLSGKFILWSRFPASQIQQTLPWPSTRLQSMSATQI
jgi:hypothetical protein